MYASRFQTISIDIYLIVQDAELSLLLLLLTSRYIGDIDAKKGSALSLLQGLILAEIFLDFFRIRRVAREAYTPAFLRNLRPSSDSSGAAGQRKCVVTLFVASTYSPRCLVRG